jgi:hypothetical protein
MGRSELQQDQHSIQQRLPGLALLSVIYDLPCLNVHIDMRMMSGRAKKTIKSAS